eukprot:TRINITY_DN32977_c0_g1_i2.p2 TRINITY_DN32977_c0_g1~~TRINITY_DN32977_c0_g1_i2.p2  ORF type:complete len:176 (+),score=54.53 TRINITY_DN32977_c0_g1_i2:28-528(+)
MVTPLLIPVRKIPLRSNPMACSVEGNVCVVRTRGNPHCHVVLRGGATGPNYGAEYIKEAESKLESVGLPANIIVDCSHGNSLKDYKKQPMVLSDIIDQIRAGNKSITGVMLESNLEEGSQKLEDPASLRYGVSITDSCLGWDDTASLLRDLASKLKDVLPGRRSPA